MSLLTMAGHTVGTSTALIMQRQWRLNQWTLHYLMDCGSCPCDVCSVPEADYVFDLNFDDEGNITDDTLDLSCVPDSVVHSGERAITINCDTRATDTDTGVATTVFKKIYLTHCDNDVATPVTIRLTDNSAAVTEDEQGNTIPTSFVIGYQQLKFLVVKNGVIRGIAD